VWEVKRTFIIFDYEKILLLSILLIFAFSCDDESDDNPLPAQTMEG